MKNLFGEEIGMAEKKEGKPKYDYGEYSRDEVISAFIKEMRLGDFDAASYWLNVMFTAKETHWYIAKRLVIFAAEDAFDPQALQIAGALASVVTARMVDENWLWQTTYWMCKARKFWECSEGRDDFERTGCAAWEALKNGYHRKIPEYAIDSHTKRGREDGIDERFSGTYTGRMAMMRMYERLGCLDKTDMEDLMMITTGDAGRELRSNGIEVTPTSNPNVWIAKSQSREGIEHEVNLEIGTCSCEDFTKRQKPCKHLMKVRRVVAEGGE